MQNDPLYNHIIIDVKKMIDDLPPAETYDFLDISKPEGEIVSDIGVISSYSCFGRTGITKITAESATGVGDYVFNYCSNIEEIHIPNANLTGTSTSAVQIFANCPKLKGIVLPAVTKTFGGFNFQNDTLLEYFDSFCAGFGGQKNFEKCTNLKTVILRKDAVVAVQNANSFNIDTPFASGGSGGTLYVPSAQLASYQANATWAAILALNANNQIKAIEGSIYETEYADGTPVA